MKIAVLNMSDIDEVNKTIACFEKIKKEIIAAKIDLFVSKDVYNQLDKNNPYIDNLVFLNIDNVNIFNIFTKNETVKYYTRYKYNIAIDTQGTLKSAYFNYLITGKTAGFRQKGLMGILISLFYDEKIPLTNISLKEEQTKKLLSKPFGFVIND